MLTLPILADMSGGERVGGDEITETGGGRDYQALPHHTTPPLRMFVQFLLRILRNFFVFSLVFLLFFSRLSSLLLLLVLLFLLLHLLVLGYIDVSPVTVSYHSHDPPISGVSPPSYLDYED